MDLARIPDEIADRVQQDRATLSVLGEGLDFDVGFFVRHDSVSRGNLGLHGEVIEATRSHIADYGRELSPVLRSALEGGLAVDREVMGKQLERTRLYREFIAPHGGHSTVLVVLAFRTQTLGLIVLGRKARGFSATELGWLRQLLPVLRVCEASRGPATPACGLTPREREVLDYLCLGYSNREIALACDTSINTVRNQLQSVYRKIGASTRAEAVGLALRGAG